MQVFCSLAIIQGSQGFEGLSRAIVFLCPPTGSGLAHSIHFGPEDEKEWRRNRAKIVAFFTARMLPLLSKGIDIANLPEPEAVSQQTGTLRLQHTASDVDQTPSVKEGKWIREIKCRTKTGVVTKLYPDGTADVDWDGKQSIRKKKSKVDNLEVIPIINNESELPNQNGQSVQILAGPHLIGKVGVVMRYNSQYTDVLVGEERVKLKIEHLKLLAPSREVTVPPLDYCLKVPLNKLEEFALAQDKESKMQSIGNISLAKFVEAVPKDDGKIKQVDVQLEKRPNEKIKKIKF